MTDKNKKDASFDVQKEKTQATLYCVNPPTDKQKKGIAAFLEKTYGVRPEINIVTDKSLVSGFRLEFGDNVFDWSAQGRVNKLKEDIRKSSLSTGGVTPLIKEAVENLKSAIENWAMPLGAHETKTA